MAKIRRGKVKVQVKLRAKLVVWLVALLVLAVLVSLLGQLPFFWRKFFPLPYGNYITDQAEANGLETAMVAAIIKVESNFKADAVSKADARGLMQLRPATAEEVARQLGHPVDEMFLERLFEPEYNITLGARYYKTMLRVFDGDEVLALVAYNAGPTKLRSWLAEGVWDGAWENRHQIPYPETRNYLDKVLRYRDKYRKHYGND